jgi:hypothetical protein
VADLLAGLPPEISGANPNIPAIGAPGSPEWYADQERQKREEEARAFATLDQRQQHLANPLAFEQSMTHAPTDGAAMTPPLPPDAALPLPPPPTPVAAPVVGAPPVAISPRPSAPGGGGHTSPAPAAPTGPNDLQQLDQTQAAQRAALHGTNVAEEKQRQGEAGNESILSDYEVAANQERQRQYNERQKFVDAAKAKADEAANNVKNFKFTDWWDSRSNAQKFAAGLGILLSGVSWEAHHVNAAQAAIQQSIKDDLDLQKQKFQSTQYAATLARQGYQDADSMAQKASVDYDRAAMLKLEGYRRQLASQLAGVKSEVGKARGAELEANLGAAQQAVRQKFIEGQADIDIKQGVPAVQKEDIRLKRAQEAHLYAEASKARAEGAGGGTGMSLKEQKVQLAVTSQLGRTLQQDKQYQKLDSERQELEQTLDALKSGNPVRYGTALDKYTHSATGLGARPSSVKLFQDRLGGTLEQAKSWIQHAQNGNPMTPAQLDRFTKAVQGQYDENTTDMGRSRKKHETGLGSNPLYKAYPAIVKSVLDDKFGTPESTQRTYTPADDGALAWANANPNDPKAKLVHERQGR